jgi:hypothetical protein
MPEVGQGVLSKPGKPAFLGVAFGAVLGASLHAMGYNESLYFLFLGVPDKLANLVAIYPPRLDGLHLPVAMCYYAGLGWLVSLIWRSKMRAITKIAFACLLFTANCAASLWLSRLDADAVVRGIQQMHLR